jgi:hypothetical protein
VAKRSPERKEFLTNVLVTAVEGGINYWADIEEYRIDEIPDPVFPGLTKWVGGSVKVRDFEGTGGKWHTVTLDTIARGIRVVTTPDFNLNRQMKSWIRDGNAENDSGDIDCWCADAIVQAAVLGEVVYG